MNGAGDRTSFGAHIRKKRLEAGLTQKELAGLLFVTESTISKWERGLSYPDVSMVPSICAALHMTEHEFFTARDDTHCQERQAVSPRAVMKGARRLFAAACAVAVAVCFLCNLAVFHTLDWFWIVLSSIALALCFTNLPFLLRRNRLPVCLGAASGCLILLFLSCWAYAGNRWIIGGMCITVVCLALPWAWWAIWRFCGRHLPPLFLGVFSVWVFALLAVIWSFSGGDWLLRLAFPIAAFCVGYGWLFLAAVCLLRVNPWLKAAVCSLLTTFAIPLGNALAAHIAGRQNAPVLLGYFTWRHFFTHNSGTGLSWINILVFYLMLACSAVLFIAGALTEVRREK